MNARTETPVKAHDFGPWLVVGGIVGHERRCGKCSAKEWKDERFGIYGNDTSRVSCGTILKGSRY